MTALRELRQRGKWRQPSRLWVMRQLGGGDANTEDSESGSPQLDAVEIAVVRNRAQELQVMANTPGQKKKFRELVKAAGCKEGTWPTNDGDLEVLCKRTAAVEYLKTTPSK